MYHRLVDNGEFAVKQWLLAVINEDRFTCHFQVLLVTQTVTVLDAPQKTIRLKFQRIILKIVIFIPKVMIHREYNALLHNVEFSLMFGQNFYYYETNWDDLDLDFLTIFDSFWSEIEEIESKILGHKFQLYLTINKTIYHNVRYQNVATVKVVLFCLLKMSSNC